VLLPLTLPAQATLGVFTFLGSWNSYWWPLISATRSDMYTLTVGLASAQMNYAQTSGLGFLMAQAVFASIPIFIVYICSRSRSCAPWPGRRCDERLLSSSPAALLARRKLRARGADDRAEIYLQRFFGECGAEYGSATDVSKVEGECGIITR
jgi:hypothetical protein